MLSMRSLADWISLSGAFKLWEGLVLKLRPDLAGAAGQRSILAALEGLRYTGIAQVPDIDQRWSTLPNQGKMWCAPTSALNLMQYLALHGDPAADAPTADVIVRLKAMGDYMDTDPVSGTDFDDNVEGIADWCEDRGAFVIVSATTFDSDVPMTADDLEDLLQFGALVNLRVGWY